LCCRCRADFEKLILNLNSAVTLARQLFVQYDLENWQFKFDHARTRFGCCNFSTKTISLSKILTELNSPQKIRDTILHEIAHALVGKNHAHDKVWKEKILAIGGRAERCFRKSEIEMPQSKFVAICPNCRAEFPTFRRHKRKVACRGCCQKFNRGKFASEFLLEFRAN
jgi:predicted SprT family Zn-dependent metalloprotease